MQVRLALCDVLGSDDVGIGVPGDFDRDGAWAEEHGRAQFADGHFAGAVRGCRVHDAVGHVYLRPYEGTAAGPDQCEYKDDMLDNARRFMLFW